LYKRLTHQWRRCINCPYAHNGSVLRAIKQAGLPYLLKPVDDEELCAMIHKVTQQPQQIEVERVQALKNQLTEYRW